MTYEKAYLKIRGISDEQIKTCNYQRGTCRTHRRFTKAIILGQFLYWSRHVKDFDKFKEQEFEISQTETGEIKEIELSYGWIYKSY